MVTFNNIKATLCSSIKYKRLAESATRVLSVDAAAIIHNRSSRGAVGGGTVIAAAACYDG